MAIHTSTIKWPPERHPERHCKEVRFGSIPSSQQQAQQQQMPQLPQPSQLAEQQQPEPQVQQPLQQQKIESPRSKWRRFGRLSVQLRQVGSWSSNSMKERQQQQQQQQRHHHHHQMNSTGGVTTTSEEDEEEESSSNSTPSHRLEMAIVPAGVNAINSANGRRSVSHGGGGGGTGAGANNSTYLAMQHSSSASTSPAVPLSNSMEKRTKKGSASDNPHGRACLFGVFHVETGTRLFLLFYILLSTCGVLFGSVATMVWILVPLVVIPLAGYALSRHASKYLYPFLVISVIHSLVALLMVLIVGCFMLLCFDQLKAHFALSLAAFPSSPFPSATFTALCCALTMALSLGMALFFFWQSLIICSCINHFDLLAQQKHQQQQIQQQQQQQLGAKESKCIQQSMFSTTQTAAGKRHHQQQQQQQQNSNHQMLVNNLSRQVDGSQCNLVDNPLQLLGHPEDDKVPNG